MPDEEERQDAMAGQKIRIRLKSYDHEVIDSSARKIVDTVTSAGATVVGPVPLPTEKNVFVVIRSPHKSQDSREHFEKAGVTPRRHLVELRTSDAADYSLGQEIDASIFAAGQKVDVVGTSKGKGTAGVMKRHGFAGVSATHGQHRNHRKPGSIGGASTPGRVFKGQRMAGRMGGDRTSVQNLTVHAVDVEKGLVLVKGAVPGPKGGLVLVRSAVKTPAKEA